MYRSTLTMQELVGVLRSEYLLLKTWRAVADKYTTPTVRVTCGMVYRIAMHDYEPRQPHIRAALSLPSLAPAPVCPKCGTVHVAKRCLSQQERPRPRRAINLADPASAAATIRRHAEPEYVAELVRLLEDG